ncbi:gliding motility-associated C-terminal domain-containing protein [Hymenobacter sp. ASUV-10]|uniref:Gliding motility-associated C-terminal domain-containing protein n=1 Tax=Hymenobacter aranciens TaxID=3063996 RepID=A0ABT9BGP2_9BACT|nr:gliding motility-associated C-terminal domain-containing protein [Hymenobacter sp. ASUV-10]MDO7876833.1 gliding motility-associated C-terminal domain-containing protein [Hymenobacter sp. ASUV-10]
MSAPVFSRFTGLLLLLLLIVGRASATHIVGGELDLQHRSGSQYTLTLNLYFDDIYGNTGALDREMQASIFDKATDARKTNLILPLTSNTFVDYTDPACAVGTLRTRKLVYRTTVTLAPAVYNSPQGYYVAIERCCRNVSISNIRSPGAAAQTFYLEFPPVTRNGQPFIDSTPQIFPPLSDYACLGDLFYYDFGGTDEDGDSLVYDMVTPLNGYSTAADPAPPAAPAPYRLVNWNAGLGTANQIPGSPPLGIDRQTGRLTVRPSSIGLFVFGVRCAEYRAGVKIGETRRDFQLYVLNCPRNATPSMVVSAGAGTYRPGRDTLRLKLGGNRCLTIKTTDPDPSTRLRISTHAVNFTGLATSFTSSSTGSIRTPGMPDTLTTTLCFPDCAETNGQVYLLDVIVADNGCSLPKRDTVRVAFTADSGGNIAPVLSSTFGATGDTLEVHVAAGATFTGTLTGTDVDVNPLVLSSGQNFNLAQAGMTFTAQNGTGQASGSFRWQPTCQTLRPADGLLVSFQLTENGVCQPKPQTQIVRFRVILPPNAPPVLSSTFASQPPADTDTLVVRVRINEVYDATLTGTDADPDPLTLTATQDFDLAAAGMEFGAQNGLSLASGTFRWRPTCQTLRRDEGLLMRFQLAENGVCQPLPQSQLVRFVAVVPQDTVAFRPPNVITPNSDGLNDYFTLPAPPADLCESRFAGVQIFSRWGQQVYQSGERSFRWGGAGLAGTYYYLITYTDGRRLKGWLDVLP